MTAHEPITIGGEVDKIKISLRLFADNLLPADITALLGVEPSASHQQGDIIYAKAGTRAKTGYWSLQLELAGDASLNDGISDLLAQLPQEQPIWDQLSQQYRMDLFIGLFMEQDNRMTSLDTTILQDITRRGIALTFDIYCL